MKYVNKYSILLIVVFVLLSLFGRTQVVVDANLSEWGDSTKMKYDSENKLWYNFKKDSDFLYIVVKKNRNASKFYSSGIQLSFSQKKIDSDAFQITFAHAITNPISNKRERFGHDYFDIRNYKGVKNQLLPKYNETGILVEWKYTDIEYNGKNTRIDEIPANPNIFTAEIQIPLVYLKENFGNKINFSICLRGYDKEKKGLQHYLDKKFPAPTCIHERELFECMFYTEYFGILDLMTI